MRFISDCISRDEVVEDDLEDIILNQEDYDNGIRLKKYEIDGAVYHFSDASCDEDEDYDYFKATIGYLYSIDGDLYSIQINGGVVYKMDYKMNSLNKPIWQVIKENL